MEAFFWDRDLVEIFAYSLAMHMWPSVVETEIADAEMCGEMGVEIVDTKLAAKLQGENGIGVHHSNDRQPWLFECSVHATGNVLPVERLLNKLTTVSSELLAERFVFEQAVDCVREFSCMAENGRAIGFKRQAARTDRSGDHGNTRSQIIEHFDVRA